MAGYWPSSLFCIFMDRDKVKVHKDTKREQGQYPVILIELAWSIKDLFYGIKNTEKKLSLYFRAMNRKLIIIYTKVVAHFRFLDF